MGTIDQKMNDYVWEHISLLEAVFSEKIYKILLHFKDKEDRESFSDTLEAVIEVDSELLENLEIIYQKLNNGIDNELRQDEVYFQLGKKFDEEKYYDKAMKYYQKVISLNPKHFKAYHNIGNIYFHKNIYKKAMKYYQKAIDINPKSDETYNNIGNIYLNNNEYDKAFEYYYQTIELNPKNTNPYNNIGVLYNRKNEHNKAIEYYKKSIKINFTDDTFHNLNITMKELNKAFFLDKKISNLNFFIQKIKIQNFKQYKNFSIEFSKKINIIVGQNATGKTTLLQAITLALLKENSIDAPSKTEYSNYITKGEEKAEIIIWHNESSKKIEILKDERVVENNYFIPFVLAYGSNIFTSSTNKVKEVAQGIVNGQIHDKFTNSIFPYHTSYTNTFINPIRLLEFLDLEKDKETISKIQDTLISEINKFLEEFELVANDKNYYFQKNGEKTRLELEDLSEGYRGNVLLITDMLIKILGVGWTPKTIEGIILIDEFDKHLHPRWQSKLVNQLTETFPKIQFIMTTHNPMSILGRNPDEITKLVETNGKIEAVRGRGTQTVDVSIVLLEYFNVDSTISDTMKNHVNNFNRLKLKKELTSKEEEELKELKKFLGETIASNFIYDRKYLKFLEFIRDHKDIDFDRYDEMTGEEMDELLKDFGDFFDD